VPLAGVHPPLECPIRRQWCSFANWLRAGNHCIACESPKMTTVLSEEVSPNTHFGAWGLCTDEMSNRHPSVNISERMSVASRGVGEILSALS
jgi:hypothetical protein